MSEATSYFTVEKVCSAEFRDRGSRFLAIVYPVSDVQGFKTRLQEVKDEHPKASHYCFAYRLGIDGAKFRSSDDGEPAGTAGKPILGQIDSKQLTNILIVVVRYFGGSLLGVPGLINAYKMASSLALQLTPIIEKAVEVSYSLQFDYSRLNDIMTLVKQFRCTVLRQELQLFCTLDIAIPKAERDVFLNRMKDMHSVDVRMI